jgi:hypothetical protein
MAKPYILPNRKAFADAITRMFLRSNYRKGDVDPLSAEEADVDLCIPRSRNTRELFPYQKLVRDYMLIETPYRGLLLYHGILRGFARPVHATTQAGWQLVVGCAGCGLAGTGWCT